MPSFECILIETSVYFLLTSALLRLGTPMVKKSSET